MRFLILPVSVFALLGLCAAQAASLTPTEERGRQIFFNGTAGETPPISARVGQRDAVLPGTAVPCKSCHGEDGTGRPEGGIFPPNITWRYLSKPYGHRHRTRSHGLFDEQLFARAVVAGIDPAGNKLDAAMPRYDMGPDEVKALVAFLKRLDSDHEPGITNDRIRIGIIRRPGRSDADTTLSDASIGAIRAYLEERNDKGGIYGRKLELVEIDLGGSEQGADLESVLKDRLRASDTFALVGGVISGIEEPFQAVIDNGELPAVGPLTFRPPYGAEYSEHVFYLFPPLAHQYAVLVEHLRVSGGAASGMVLVASDGYRESGLVGEIQDYVRARGDLAMDVWVPNANRLTTSERPDEKHVAPWVLFAGDQDALEAYMKLGKLGPGSTLLAPSVLLNGQMINRLLSSGANVRIGYSTMANDLEPDEARNFMQLQREHRLESQHTAVQLSSIAAAKLLVHAIREGGKQLTRHKLETALNRLYDFKTGILPAVSFNQQNHIGLRGGYVVSLSAGEGKIKEEVSGWIVPQ